MSQTTFTTDPGPGQAGEIASSADSQLNSGQVDFGESGIEPGTFVVRGSGDGLVSTPSSAGDITDEGFILGPVFLDPSKEAQSYDTDDFLTYAEKGEVWCEVAASEVAGPFAAGAPVYVVFQGADKVGTVSDNDGGTPDAALVANAQFPHGKPSGATIAVVKFHR